MAIKDRFQVSIKTGVGVISRSSHYKLYLQVLQSQFNICFYLISNKRYI